MPVKINGATSGSVTLAAPATGSDVTLTLPAAAGTAATTAYADTAGGLQLITTQTFSAVSSVSVNNCFSVTYDNYRLMLDITSASGDVEILFRMRASGSDNTASAYQTQRVFGYGTTLGASRPSVGTSSLLVAITANGVPCSADIYRPNLAQRTNILGSSGANYSGGVELLQTSSLHNVSSAFDGITLFTSSGTATGTLRVYGYKNGA